MSSASLTWLTAVFLAACGGDGGNGPGEPDTLAVTAVEPEDGADDVATDAQLTATFNRDIDPATLTPESFVLSAGGTPLATAVSYDAASRTARLSGPLLPGTLYETELTTAITDAEAGPLSAAEQWSFATRSWASTVVDGEDDVGATGSLAVDGSGGLHVTYYDASNGDLKYATCATACGSSASWTAAPVDQAGTVGLSSSLALEAGGRLHVVYWDIINEDVKYATCAESCTTTANWTAVAVDQDGDVGQFGISLLVEGNGRLHLSYYDLSESVIAYATCGAACTTPANWTTVPVDETAGGGFSASLAIDGSGRLHLVYFHFLDLDLLYSTCSTDCTTEANWTSIAADQTPGAVGTYASLAVAGNGGLHVSYFDGSNGDLKYATCGGSCSDAPNWAAVTVDSIGDVGTHTSIRVGGDGRRHVTYYDETNDALKYATCAADCASAAGWQSAAVDQAGDVGRTSSLALDPNGGLHATYHDTDNGDLKYIE